MKRIHRLRRAAVLVCTLAVALAPLLAGTAEAAAGPHTARSAAATPAAFPTREQIAQLAYSQAGDTCQTYTNGSCDPSFWWCAAFAEWVWRTAGETDVPTTEAAQDMGLWAEQQGLFKTSDPQPGDLVLFGPPAPTGGGHVGIVYSVNPDGTLTTVNGDYGPGPLPSDNHVEIDRINPATARSGADDLPISGYISPPQLTLSAHPIYHTVRNANGTWVGWGEVQGAGSAPDFAASYSDISAAPDGSSQVIAIGDDGDLYHTLRNANGSWDGWGELQGVGSAPTFAARDAAIAVDPNGSSQVVAIGNDGMLYHTLRNADGTWTGWGELQGVGAAPDFFARAVAISAGPDNSLQVVAIGGDGMLYHCIRNADGTWVGWGQLQGVGSAPDFAARAVSIAVDPDGSSQVIAVGDDGMLYHTLRNANGTWTGWGEVQGAGAAPDFAASAVSIAADPDGSAQVIAVAADGLLYHCVRNADGTWVGWGRVQGAGAAPDFAAGDVAITAFSDGSAQIVATAAA